MKKYFITATGTNIGKTLVTAALASQLQAQGKKVRALKPVASGYDATQLAHTDSGQLLQAQHLSMTDAALEAISPWRFAAPLSPDMAAEAEGKEIDFDRLIHFCKAQHEMDYLLIEGVGGIMVPLDKSHTTLDWMAALGYPVILVAGSYLGSISHTLTACHMALARGLVLQCVIISESEESPVPLAQLTACLARFLPYNLPLQTIRRLDSSPELWKYAPDLTHVML